MIVGCKPWWCSQYARVRPAIPPPEISTVRRVDAPRYEAMVGALPLFNRLRYAIVSTDIQAMGNRTAADYQLGLDDQRGDPAGLPMAGDVPVEGHAIDSFW